MTYYDDPSMHDTDPADIVFAGVPADATEDDAETAILDLARDLASRGVYMLDSIRVRTMARLFIEHRDGAQRQSGKMEAIGSAPLSVAYTNGSAAAYGIACSILSGLLGGIDIDIVAADPDPFPSLDDAETVVDLDATFAGTGLVAVLGKASVR